MFIVNDKRQSYTPEFRDEAVKLVINTGRPIATVARELGLKEPMLGRWVNVYRDRVAAGGEVVGESEHAELARLRREVAELRLDRAFLKKASVFFAQEASDTNEKRTL